MQISAIQDQWAEDEEEEREINFLCFIDRWTIVGTI